MNIAFVFGGQESAFTSAFWGAFWSSILTASVGVAGYFVKSYRDRRIKHLHTVIDLQYVHNKLQHLFSKIIGQLDSNLANLSCNPPILSPAGVCLLAPQYEEIREFEKCLIGLLDLHLINKNMIFSLDLRSYYYAQDYLARESSAGNSLTSNQILSSLPSLYMGLTNLKKIVKRLRRNSKIIMAYAQCITPKNKRKQKIDLKQYHASFHNVQRQLK